jgi:hypothetical protein
MRHVHVVKSLDAGTVAMVQSKTFRSFPVHEELSEILSVDVKVGKCTRLEKQVGNKAGATNHTLVFI